MEGPVNIRRLIRDNDALAAAETYHHELQAVAKSSAWFNKQFLMDANRGTKPVEQADKRDVRVIELKAAAATLLLQRQYRLTQLLQAEREQYAAELAARGLAFHVQAL